MAFSNKLKETMARREMRAADLARETGLSEAIISEYLSGKKEPRGKQSVSIARALRISLDELWETGFSGDEKAPASEQELSKEARYIAMCFERADEDGKALLRHVADYIDGSARQSSAFEYSEEAQAAAEYLDRTLGLPAESPAFADLKNA